MMMIIKIGLCGLGMGFFFTTNTITPWLSTTTITNCRMVDNYKLSHGRQLQIVAWSTIMCYNDHF